MKMNQFMQKIKLDHQSKQKSVCERERERERERDREREKKKGKKKKQKAPVKRDWKSKRQNVRVQD